jgi:soluble lytic murein transglycosylase-like protein
MILRIAVAAEVPPGFALAIALVENPELNPAAVNVNSNNTVDRGVMQLNSSWFTCDEWDNPEVNISAGISLIKRITQMEGVHTYWTAALVYNAGYGRIYNPPESTVNYANRVMETWTWYEGGYVNPIIQAKCIGR